MATATTAPVADALPKLYVYDNCPFCVRTRAVFGLKNVDHTLIFVANHDEATPIGLVGAKQTPIIELPSGKAFPESGDIMRYVDENYGDEVILKEASGREDLKAWNGKTMKDILSLLFPKAVKAPFAEFASKKSRVYFQTAKEKFVGPFAELEAKSPELLAKVNEYLKELDGLVYSDRLVNESGLSYDDLAVFSTLRGLTLVKGIEWPAKLRAFTEYYSEVGDVPLLDGMAL